MGAGHQLIIESIAEFDRHNGFISIDAYAVILLLNLSLDLGLLGVIFIMI